MARKPNSMYRRVKSQAYTRREYVGGVPNLRIVRFETGNRKAKFPMTVTLVARERCHIRHNALEAARITATRHLTKRIGPKAFHMKIRIYPHIVLRENKQATGAGADRISQGMRASFGKNVGTAARVYEGQKLISIHVGPEDFLRAKDALRKASMKFPTPCQIVVDKGKELVKGL